MNSEPRRKFSISDMLLLTAGLALGFALVRVIAPNLTPRLLVEAFARPPEGWSIREFSLLIAELGALIEIPMLAAVTPAILLLQLLKPRPNWRHLRRQPGFLATLLATSVVVLSTVACVIGFGSGLLPFKNLDDSVGTLNIMGGTLAGSCVLGGWLTLSIIGRRRPRSTWTDRLGQVVGLAWIFSAIIGFALLFLSAYPN